MSENFHADLYNAGVDMKSDAGYFKVEIYEAIILV